MARKLRILYDGAICRVAFSGNVLVTADGIVTALTTDAAVPRLGLDYRLAAVTPRGLKRGIAGACSGTNPLQPDTDGDCMTDGWEVRHDFNPREVQTDGIHGAGDDPDGDGLSNLEECQHGTDPFNPDTDGDGVWDGDEVPHSPGSCPSDASDNGSSTNCVTLKLTVGDPSGSNSERWNLEVFEEATGRAVARHCDDGFGTPGSAEHSLVKGKAYTFSLRRVATNRGNHPDYDWRALINNSTEAGAYSGLYGTGAFIVEDAEDLLTDETHGDDTDITIGKQGRIIVPKIRLEPVTCATTGAGVIVNPCGVKKTYGFAAYRVDVEPEDAVKDEDICWSVPDGGVTFHNGQNTGREVIIKGGSAERDFKLEVQIGDLPETCRPYIHGRVLEPKTVPVRAYIICSNGVPAVATSTINGWIAEANRIYRQVAVTFVLESVQNVHGHDLWFHIGDAVEFFQMTSYTNGTGGA